MYTYEYPRPAVTVDAIVYYKIYNSSYILLVQRGSEPYKNHWSLPGGFVEIDELLETACIRELEEETGLKVEKMTQFKVYDAIDRDPRSRTLSVTHYAIVDEKKEVKGDDDASDAKWFNIEELPKLAFDHDLIIKDFLAFYQNS